MKTTRSVPVRRAIATAVRCALIAMAAAPAYAADDEKTVDPAVAELTQPHSAVEAGAGYVSKDSYKFGEYNGLNRQGLYGILDLDVRGGGRYDSTDTTRWRILGTDLGLDSRSLLLDYGRQGSFRLNLGYDEIRRNRSDTYQTPYLGAGSNTLTLPSNWLVPLVPAVSATAPNARGLSADVAASSALVAGVLTAPTPAQQATSSALIAADLPAFQKFNLRTKRERVNLGANVLFGPRWDFTVSARHEDKTGTKPMGTVTRASGGDISTIIPDLIDQSTDQFNLGASFRGESSFFQAAYYGSVFRNNVKSMTWQNWALGAPTFATMSSAPSNDFHQFSLTGGYNLAQTVKLVANASYGRARQDDAFLTDASTPLVPVASLHGLVETTNLGLKLTGRPTRELNFAAGYKYEDRNNKTPVNTYAYYDANQPPGASVANAAFLAALGLPAGALTGAANINANRPYSRKLNQLDLEGDYHVARAHWLKAGYTFQKLDRFCDGSWVECADARTTKENTVRAEWRTNATDRVSGRVDYSYAWRKVDAYNENAFLAIVPMAGVVPAGATLSAYEFLQAMGLTGYGPVAGLPAVPLTGDMALYFPNNNALANALYANGNRISELIGMRRYNMADRDRNRVRSAIDWQAADRVAVHGGADFNDDRYSKSVYGLQKARSWALNLDTSYTPTDTLTLGLFATHEDKQSRSAGNSYTANSTATAVNGFTTIVGGCFDTIAARNANNKIDPCTDWNARMRDKIDTVGLSASKREAFASRLDLGGSLTWSRARTDNRVSGGTYVNNPLAVAGAPAGTVAAFFIPTTPLPTVKTDVIDVRIGGKYQLNRASAVRVGYQFEHLRSVDYAYEGMQLGGLTGVLPSFEQAPTYNVHVVGISYIYTFQ
jgi:MtrB/PioB family decaheme-associated outer membrane protein